MGSGKTGPQQTVFLLSLRLLGQQKGRTGPSQSPSVTLPRLDSVCRELLYTKLSNIGFGGKVVSLTQSMYYNDCVRISLLHGLTEPLYFTRGVKQGCSLSPMLFALYISRLGEALGVRMGSSIISALFFADNLVLISNTPKTGMNKLLGIVAEFCRDMRMELSTSKTFSPMR